MRATTQFRTVVRPLAVSTLAQLPLAAIGIGLLVHAKHLTGSYAAAGLVSGAYAAALGAGGPLLGRLADRRGQTFVLIAGAGLSAVLLITVAALPVGSSVWLLVALTAGVGLVSPPVSACIRSLLPSLVDDPDLIRTFFAVEASAIELTFIAGPPLALAIACAWSTAAALIACAAVMLVATVAFAAEPSSRAWQPQQRSPETGEGLLRSHAVQTLILALVLVGVLFGAVEIAVTAAATRLSGAGTAAPLLGLWGAGSLVGGLVSTRFGGGALTAKGLALILAALAASHALLALTSDSIALSGAVLFIAGAAIAPTYATVYAMVGSAAPPGTSTEAFAWLGTAVAVGTAAGAAAGGVLIDHTGIPAAIVLAAACGATAALLILLRNPSLPADDRCGRSSRSPVSSASAIW